MKRFIICSGFLVAIAFVLTSCSRSTSTSKSVELPVSSADEANSLSELRLDDQVAAILRGGAPSVVESLVREADDLKGGEQYADAAAHYLAALRVQPKHLWARYQLAGDLALWGHRRLALSTLRQAITDGFWGYEMMRGDTDFESIKDDPEFASMLASIMGRYATEAKKHEGRSFIRAPQGTPPARGWPIVIFLHGMGDRADAYVPNAESASEQGYAGIAVSAPVVQWENQYAWPSEKVETTHAYLQKVLDGYRERKDLDRSRVFLVGFSQGAVHAAGLLAQHSRDYSGAIILSPGGPPGIPQTLEKTASARPLCAIHGEKEHPICLQSAESCVGLWKKAKWPVLQETHPGGHQIPEDFEDRFPRLMKWLEQNSK